MKIFITGVAGFLGSHLADRMLSLGHEVSGNDTLVCGYIDNVPANITFYEVDCCNITEMTRLLNGVDVVIHAAATAHEGLSIFSPSFITRNIFEAGVATISAAIQNKVKRFVFCSSMARYGNEEYPFKETQRPSPVDPYGIAKVAVEDILKILAPMNDMEWNIAVPHNIVGPRQRYDDPYRNVMSIMINRVLQGNAPIIYGDGSQVRCFSFIDDCLYCLEKLTLDPDITSELVNIGPDEEFITIKTLAESVITALKFDGSPIYIPDRPREVKNAICDSTKARALLGYKTSMTFLDGLNKTIHYIKQRGSKPFDYDSYPLEIINQYTPETWSRKTM